MENEKDMLNNEIASDDVLVSEPEATEESKANKEDTSEVVVESAVTESSPMTDDEIRESAQKIGSSPYEEYQNYSGYQAYTSYNYDTTYDFTGTYKEVEEENKPEKKHPMKKFWKFVGLAAAFGIIAGGSFFGVTSALNKILGDKSVLSAAKEVKQITVQENVTSTATTQNVPDASNLGMNSLVIGSTNTVASDIPAKNNTVVNVVEENMSCAIMVNATYVTSQRVWGQIYNYESTGGGSGFIVGSNETELLIATNNHVVENAVSIEVTFNDGMVYEATVRGTDPENDLAIISVLFKNMSEDTMESIKIAKLGDSDKAMVGEMVIAIGNALGYGQSVTVGYISAKNREVTIDDNKMYLLQTDAAINGGNSGGPLFNAEGEVIGINCAKYSDTAVEGMGFAIPISKAMPILEDLMTKEIIAESDQGYLGVSITDVTEELSNIYGLPIGIYVSDLSAGGSAEKAGIYKGDIIVAVNGKEVKTSAELQKAVKSNRYGTTVTVTLMRQESGKWVSHDIEVTLMKRPE